MSQTNEFQPILLGSDINVYGMARSFHEEFGITSLALSIQKLLKYKLMKILTMKKLLFRCFVILQVNIKTVRRNIF